VDKVQTSAVDIGTGTFDGGKVECTESLGGLLKSYYLAAYGGHHRRTKRDGQRVPAQRARRSYVSVVTRGCSLSEVQRGKNRL